MPLTSQPMCSVSGTNCSAAAAGSLVETMLIARLLSLSILSCDVLAQKACRRERRFVQHNIRLDCLRELVRRSSHGIDAHIAQHLDEFGIASERRKRARQALDDRLRGAG